MNTLAQAVTEQLQLAAMLPAKLTPDCSWWNQLKAPLVDLTEKSVGVAIGLYAVMAFAIIGLLAVLWMTKHRTMALVLLGLIVLVGSIIGTGWTPFTGACTV